MILQVEQYRTRLDVIEIVVDARDGRIGLRGAAAATADLRQPGDAGPNHMTLKVVRHQILVYDAAGEHTRYVRTWPDQRHVAFDDVDELRQFVEAGRP